MKSTVKEMRRWLLLVAILCSLLVCSYGKTVKGRLDVGYGNFEYLSKFCFGIGTGSFRYRFSDSVVNNGYEVAFYMDEIWDKVLAEESCEDRLERYRHQRGQLTQPTPNEGVEGHDPPGMSAWMFEAVTQHVRPHYWYAVLVNCKKNTTLRQTPVHFDLEFKNQDSHFSEDDNGLYSWTLVVFAICTVVGFCIVARLKFSLSKHRNNKGRFHPVIGALVAALALHYGGVVCHLMHYVGYASNGVGWGFIPFETFSLMLHEASKLCLTTLFIVLSQGFTITTDTIPNRDKLVPIICSISALELIGMGMQMLYADSHDAYSSRAREGFTGLFLIMMQLGLYYWFLVNVKKAISVESSQMSARRGFFTAFAFCCSIWFLAEPVLLVLGYFFANYYRQRLLIGGSLLIQTVALILLSRLFLWRSLYFKISNMSDSVLPGGRGSTGAHSKDI